MKHLHTIPPVVIRQGPITKDIVRQFLPKNPVVVEAGAHIGRDTIKMATLWPEATIYAFEPVPELFRQLKERTQDFANVYCYQLALSDRTGTAHLNVSTGATTAASSLLEPHEYKKERRNVSFHTITVETVTLDAWAQKEKIERIDFLWLDMQGHELAVLKVAPRMLSTVSALVVEASLTERFKGNPLYNEVRSWIEAQGFKAVLEDNPKHEKINILFIRKP